MDTIGHGQSSKLPAVKPPRYVGLSVRTLEVALVAFIGYQAFALVSYDVASNKTGSAGLAAPEKATSMQVDLDRIRSFDPFFRDVAVAVDPDTARAPESTLKVELFGLRAMGDGGGSAIVKMPDSEQKLVRMGDMIAPGITLAGVYPDRLEISRGGLREAVYLRPQAERSAVRPAPVLPNRQQANSSADATDSALIAGIGKLKLEPVRRNSHIVGFRLPDDTPFLLTAMGLQAGDILMAANGAPLTSFERITELGDELKGEHRVELTIERRGETRSLTIGL